MIRGDDELFDAFLGQPSHRQPHVRQHALHVFACAGHLVLAALVNLTRRNDDERRARTQVFQLAPKAARVFQP